MKINKTWQKTKIFRNWFIHPQFLMNRYFKENVLPSIINFSKGIVVDIGCGYRQVEDAIRSNNSHTNYIGLDYPETGINLYEIKPDIYGDARYLPFKQASVDTILFLEVMEHLTAPERAIKEISQILKPKGYLLLSVPFLYPVHDVPFDFHRFTYFGIHHILEKNGLRVLKSERHGNFIDTAAVNLNMFCLSMLRKLLEQRNYIYFSLLFILSYPLMILGNLAAFILRRIAFEDRFYLGMFYVCQK